MKYVAHILKNHKHEQQFNPTVVNLLKVAVMHASTLQDVCFTPIKSKRSICVEKKQDGDWVLSISCGQLSPGESSPRLHT